MQILLLPKNQPSERTARTVRPATQINLAALASVPFVMVLSNSMLIPVLPAMQKAMGITPFQVGLVITAFSIPAGLFIPLGGYLSDRYGRKAVMVPALFLFGLGGLLAALAALFMDKPFLALLAARVLQGIGGGGTYQVAMALVGDIFQTEERSKALGVLEAANGLGKVVAPILGSLAAILAWFAPYFIYPILAWGSSLAVWFMVKEPSRKGAGAIKGVSDYLTELIGIWQEKNKNLGVAFAAGGVTLFILFGVLSYYSDLMESKWGIRGLIKGFVIAIPVLVMAVTSYVTGTVLQKHLRRFGELALLCGLAATAVALAAAAFVKGMIPFTAMISLAGAGTGVVLPSLNNTVTGATGAGERGGLTALYGTVRFFGAALGPPVAGHLMGIGQMPLLLGGALLAGGIGAAAFALGRTALGRDREPALR